MAPKNAKEASSSGKSSGKGSAIQKPKRTKPRITAKQRAFTFKDQGIIEECGCGAILCTICSEKLSNKKHLIEQHFRTKKHKTNAGLKQIQQTLPSMKCQKTFCRDVCLAFVGSNIPLTKLKSPALRKFFHEYVGRSLPDESIIRRNYLQVAYNETTENIRLEIGNHPIWVSIDETTDTNGRYIANVIVGAMKNDEPGRAFLLHTMQLTSANSQTIARTLSEALHILWPQGIQYDRVYVFISDGAAYMVKAARDLTILYPKMIHVTCLAHALHQLAECIISRSPKADKLISAVKKIFLKAHSRIVKLKEMYPDLPLPPAPVTTRWGTWLKAISYYAKNWNKIRAVVDALRAEDATGIKEAQTIFADTSTFEEVTFVEKYYSFIPNSIAKLETAGLSVQDTLQTLGNVIQKIAATPDSSVKDKLHVILSKNPGLSAMNAINANDKIKLSTFPQLKDMSPAEIAKFSFAPLVSCDVERSFSQYKLVLAANRRNFQFPNLKYYIVVECNANHFSGDEMEADYFDLYSAYDVLDV